LSAQDGTSELGGPLLFPNTRKTARVRGWRRGRSPERFRAHRNDASGSGEITDSEKQETSGLTKRKERRRTKTWLEKSRNEIIRFTKTTGKERRKRDETRVKKTLTMRNVRGKKATE